MGRQGRRPLPDRSLPQTAIRVYSHERQIAIVRREILRRDGNLRPGADGVRPHLGVPRSARDHAPLELHLQ